MYKDRAKAHAFLHEWIVASILNMLLLRLDALEQENGDLAGGLLLIFAVRGKDRDCLREGLRPLIATEQPGPGRKLLTSNLNRDIGMCHEIVIP